MGIDFLSAIPRFQPEVFDDNLKLVDEVQKLASKKGATAAQIAIAWVKAHSKANGLPEIIPIPGATTVDRVKENMKNVTLSADDMEEINKILKNFEVKGKRYPEWARVEGETPEL
jgi:pyridoxine 4-dehydrogenase